ncbi:MAG: tripartite tricarboxylate transporter permease [Bacillota bacterium]
MIENLLYGMEILFTWTNLLAVLIGVTAGIAVGVLPGLGPSIGVALLVPFTYTLDPATSLILLAALYVGAEYGGSISAILISTPGTAAAVATVIDGYALNQRGFPGKALNASLISSTVGGIISTLFLIFLSIPLASFALRFGPPEYFSLGVFGLAIVASLSGKSLAKGLLMAVLGLIVTTVGVDPISGVPRFTFGRYELLEGIPFLPALIGMFAIAEVFKMLEESLKKTAVTQKIESALLSLKEIRSIVPTILRGSVIGSLVGTIPGAGAGVACWIAYDQEKRLSKNPDEFGKGALAGIAAPESANNATVGGALVPLLALGVPGSPTTAIMLGALMLHGLQPGPQLFVKNPDVVYSLFVSLFFACILMLFVGLMFTKLWIKILSLPISVLGPIIFALSVIGAFTVRKMVFDVFLAFGFGILGFIFKKYEFPLAPAILGMVLGFMIEANLRRSLLLSQGDFSIFFTRPLSLLLIVLALVSFIYPIYKGWKKEMETKKVEEIKANENQQ